MRVPSSTLLAGEIWSMHSFFLVVSAPSVEGERFAIVGTDAFVKSMFDMFESRSASPHRYAGTLLTEDEIRGWLAERGLAEDAVDAQIGTARRIRWSWEQTTAERITTPGYRNSGGQEVISKTELPGSLPGQRVYVMKCNRCGHEYGSNGCDVSGRRCPNCQDGLPSLPISDILR